MDDRIVHVLPVADAIVHEDEGRECVCGVDLEWIINMSGTTALIVTHHSLDGREVYEAYGTP